MSKLLSPTARRQKGFTLIELLIVIAIIGILALIILLALMNARRKGQDAKIKSDVEQCRTQAEVIADNSNGSYAGATTADASIAAMSVDASTQGTALGISAWTSGYKYSGRMRSDTATQYCVDSTGNAYTGTAMAAGATCQ